MGLHRPTTTVMDDGIFLLFSTSRTRSRRWSSASQAELVNVGLVVTSCCIIS